MYCIIIGPYMDYFKFLRPFVLKWIDSLPKRKKMINAPVMTQKQTREVKPWEERCNWLRRRNVIKSTNRRRRCLERVGASQRSQGGRAWPGPLCLLSGSAHPPPPPPPPPPLAQPMILIQRKKNQPHGRWSQEKGLTFANPDYPIQRRASSKKGSAIGGADPLYN